MTDRYKFYFTKNIDDDVVAIKNDVIRKRYKYDYMLFLGRNFPRNYVIL